MQLARRKTGNKQKANWQLDKKEIGNWQEGKLPIGKKASRIIGKQKMK